MMEDAKKSFSAFLLCFQAEGEAHMALLIPRLNVKLTLSLLKFLQNHLIKNKVSFYPIPTPPQYHSQKHSGLPDHCKQLFKCMTVGREH